MTESTRQFPKIIELRKQRKKLSELLPHPENPRDHPPKGTPEWETLRESLFDDYFDPIVWNERNGMLVGGHYRRKIFLDEGVEEVDVVVVNYDEPTHLARLFAANKQLGVDNAEKRRELFLRLHEIPDFKVSLTGFTQSEFDKVLLNESVNPDDLTGRDTDDEKTPRDSTKLNAVLATCKQGHIQVKEGEKWCLGRHILFCGPLTKTRFETELISQRAEHESMGMQVLFIPCPDPYMALTDRDDVILVMVQPDDYVASHIASNFSITFPDEQCLKL
jgi:hypothetical protein